MRHCHAMTFFTAEGSRYKDDQYMAKGTANPQNNHLLGDEAEEDSAIPSSELLYQKPDWHTRKMLSRKDKIRKSRSANKRKCKKQSGEEHESHDSTLTSTIPEVVELTKEFKDLLAKTPDFWTAVYNYDIFKNDAILSYVEGVVQLVIVLTDKDVSTKVAIASLMLYVKTLIKDNKSLIATIGEHIDSLFIAPQGEDSSFLEALRECRANWKMFKNNKLCKKISTLLTLIVSLGICEATSLDFSIGKMKIIEPRTFEVQMSAFDMTDAVLDTLAFFIEGGCRCYMTGSLKPLLYDDFKVIELEEEFINLSRMWDLQQNGNLLKIEGITATEFDNRLEKCISCFKDMLGSFSGFDKKIVTDKYNKLLQIKSDFVLTRLSGDIRRAPYTIELFGGSGQGKTCVGNSLVDALLLSANLPLDKTRRSVVSASSKFMDTWKSDHLVAILDDMCNEKSNFVERPPTRWVIDICNNQTFTAPKAELEAKGAVYVEPEIVVINTNKKDLDAFLYSNCPYSVQRRAPIIATIKAKSMFQGVHNGVECGLSPEKVQEYYKFNEKPAIEDLWDIDVEVAVKPSRLSEVASYTPLIYNGKPMTGIGMNEFVEMNIDLFNKHRQRQMEIVENSTKGNKLRLCGHEGCINMAGTCSLHSDYVSLPSYPAGELEIDEDSDDEDEDDMLSPKQQRNWFSKLKGKTKKTKSKGVKPKMKKQHGEIMAGAIHKSMTNFQTKSDEQIVQMEGIATKGLYIAASYFVAKWDWLQLIPEPVVLSNIGVSFIKTFTKDEIVKRTNIILNCLMFIATILSGVVIYYLPRDFWFPVLTGLWTIVLSCSKLIYQEVEKAVYASIVKRTKIMAPMLEKFKNDNYKVIMGLSSIVFSIVVLRSVYKAYLKIKPEQGNIIAPTEEEVKQRDSEKNPYVEVSRRPLPIEGKGRTVSYQDMENILNKNLLYGSVNVGEKKMMVNVLMLCTNYMIIPQHYLEHGSTTMTCRRNNPGTLGGNYQVRLDIHNVINIEDSELAVVYVAEGGSYKNIIPLLISDFPGDHPFCISYRKRCGGFLHGKGLAVANKKCNNGKVFQGVDYHNLSFDTFGGLCGAVLYNVGTGCNITGVHVGGVDGRPIGCASIPRRDQINIAIEKLSKKFTCIKTGDDTQFPNKQFGVEFLTKDELHPKSPINFLPENSTICYHGSCIGKTTSHSDVKKTLISEVVREESGIPNKWQPPAMKPEWKGWQDCLANLSEPGKSLPYDLVEHCAKDYVEPLVLIVKDSFWSAAKPLSDEENLLGIPGKRFMDAIKKSTSMGYPLTGPKSKFLVELEATESYPHNFKFTDDVMKEIQNMEEAYKLGKRAYPIAKACKKDEVLPKEKCRIFYGNSICLTWLIRKYYLPLIRILQMNPLMSECAVGINSGSKEWDQMYRHITKFDNLIGGDYKKYDQKLPAQLIITAFKILITLAKECNYTKDDLAIMEAMVADVAYAYIAFNGDLVSLTCGTHISGNSLTVIINGICGALNLRACFYANNSWELKYRDCVAIMTYGDDNLGSASKDCKFDIILISDFLKKYGQTYTMPNKTGELERFLKKEDFEFLKRETRYIPEIDCHVGALQTDSIYKCLHMYIRGKSNENSEEEACALNIDTAVREFFHHGREVYDQQQAILTKIARRAEIEHFCTELKISFDDRVSQWKEKYDDAYKSPSSDKTLKDPPRMVHGVEEEVEDTPVVVVTGQ